MKKITQAELGMSLPIGIRKGKTLQKDFSLRPYKAKHDRFLAAFREANHGKSMAYLVAKFLSIIVERAGHQSYALTKEGDSTAEDVLRFQHWPDGDVLYAYLVARIQSVGKWMNIPYACGVSTCGQVGTFKADLTSTEVEVLETVDEIEQWIELPNGFRLRDNTTVPKIKLRPMAFNVRTFPGASTARIDEITPDILREVVVGVEGKQGRYNLTNEEIDEIPKADMLAINRLAGRISAGPLFVTRFNCPKCNAPILNEMNWSFDHFFDSSVPDSTLKLPERSSTS